MAAIVSTAGPPQTVPDSTRQVFGRMVASGWRCPSDVCKIRNRHRLLVLVNIAVTCQVSPPLTGLGFESLRLAPHIRRKMQDPPESTVPISRRSSQ